MSDMSNTPEPHPAPLGCAIVEACIVAAVVLGLLVMALLASGNR